ncbi:MAG: UDP-N-acetylmuramate dehydrogenase [Acutalibacteraceae bacterium]|nr:UDP-N-acetylmuramate dehydrogenase [Acutalibacteraceae bacterium]
MRVDSLKALADKLKIKYSENEAMALHTSFKIGGAADIFLRVDSVEQLIALLSLADKEGVPCFILGSGSNLLVSDKGIEGAVISTAGFTELCLEDETTIRAGAGVSLAALCCFARDNGLTGLEFAYGIPGTVGGAMYMNAGAYGGDMSQVAISAQSLDGGLNVVSRPVEELDLSYRHSIFEKNGEVILSATFRLKKGDSKTIAEDMNNIIEKRKKSQPLEYPSAGSTFKRPEGYFAAALIDGCGLKGRSVGGARVSEKHAGFVINSGGATCEDVLRLIEIIKETVKSAEGVELSTEVIFVGRS